MYGGLRAANTEIMNDMFRREQADRAQQNADRAFEAQQEQRGIENERADRAHNMQQQQYDRAQQNADRAFQLDVEKTNADISFKEHESAWKDEVYKRNIAEADMRIEAAQRIADKDRAKAEADKQSADGFLYSASKILLGGGGERFSFGNGADGKPIFAMDVPIAGTNNKITIDDAFKLSSAQVESLRASGVPILGNVQNIIMHTNNDTGKKEFLIVNEDKSVTPMSEDQMYNASMRFGGQDDADAIFGRSNETRQMETFKQQQDILHKNKMEELQTTRAVSAYTSFIKSMKDMGYDVEEINKMWDSPTNPIKKMLMGDSNGSGGNGAGTLTRIEPGSEFIGADGKKRKNTLKKAIFVDGNGNIATNIPAATGTPAPSPSPTRVGTPEPSPSPSPAEGDGGGDVVPTMTEQPNPQTEEPTEEVQSPTAVSTDEKKGVPFVGGGMRYSDLMGYNRNNAVDDGYARTDAGIRDARAEYDAEGGRPQIGKRFAEYERDRGTIRAKTADMYRTPEERRLGEGAMTALNAASFGGAGLVGTLAGYGMTAASAKRIADGRGTIEDQQMLIGALVGAGMNTKTAMNKAKQYMGEAWNEGTRFNSQVRGAKTGSSPIDIGTNRKMPKAVESNGFSNNDRSLAYLKLDRNGVEGLKRGFAEGEWQTSEKLGKGVNSAFDTKADGFKGAIVTVKKDKVGNGKTAPRLEDLEGIWVNKGGKKVNVLPQILEQSKKGLSSAQQIGRKYSEKIGKISDALGVAGDKKAAFTKAMSEWMADAKNKGKSTMEFVTEWAKKNGKHYIGDYAGDVASRSVRKIAKGGRAVREGLANAASRTGGLVTSSVGKAVTGAKNTARSIHEGSAKALDRAFPEARSKHHIERLAKELDMSIEKYSSNYGLDEYFGLKKATDSNSRVVEQFKNSVMNEISRRTGSRRFNSEVSKKIENQVDSDIADLVKHNTKGLSDQHNIGWVADAIVDSKGNINLKLLGI